MSLISTMQKAAQHGYIKGSCAHCKGDVYESLAMLDDAYNVWLGKCPHCCALNFLGLTSLRGYSSAGMDLVLPTPEEVEQNNLPKDCPTRPNPPTAGKGMIHGTIAGELYHQLASADDERGSRRDSA